MAKITKEFFEKKIEEIYSNKFKVVEFTEYKDYCIIHHNKCNNDFKIKPTQIYSERTRKPYLNDTCPKCRKSFKLKSVDEVNEQLKEITKDRIIIIDDNYKNVNASTLCKCKVCNNEFYTRVSSLINNVKTNLTDSFGCPYCSGKHKMNTEEIKNKLKSLVGDEYILKSEYINNSTKIDLYHKNCNKIYSVTPDKFFNRGDRCPCMTDKATSKKVKFIENIITKLNFNYTREYKFNDLFYKNDKHLLKFDFYINENFIIEFDGSQHFKQKYYENDFNESKERDNLKNMYCIKNNISFLRIPYKISEEDIKNILETIYDENKLLEYVKKYNLLYHSNNITYNLTNYYKTYMLGSRCKNKPL